MLAALLSLGNYNCFRWAAAAAAPPPAAAAQRCHVSVVAHPQAAFCRGDDMSMLTYGLLACSSYDAEPCDLKLLHAATRGGKTNEAGEAQQVLRACVGMHGNQQAHAFVTQQVLCPPATPAHAHMGRKPCCSAADSLLPPCAAQDCPSGARWPHTWTLCGPCAASPLWASTCCGTSAGRT
jgi:hypothetical protein